MKSDVHKYLEIDLYQLKAYWDDLSRIDVRFSRTPGGAPVKTNYWKPDGTGNCINEGTMLLVPWTREETHRIKENTAFWVDVRPTFTSGMDYLIRPFQRIMTWSVYEDGILSGRNTGWIEWDEETKTLTIL